MLSYLTLARSGAAPLDVLVRTEPETSVKDLLSALGVDPSTVSAWAMGDRVLGPQDRLGDLVLDGSMLHRVQGAGPQPATRTKPGSGVSQLQIVAGPDAGRVWHLKPGRYVIGRGEDCDVVLNADPRTSRRHVSIAVDERGALIEDLGSANGVSVAGRRVSQERIDFQTPIQVGETVLSLAPPPGSDAVVAADGTGGRAFSRPPRLRPSRIRASVTMPPKPSEHGKLPFPLLGAIAPVVVGVLLAVITKRPEYLLFTALSPIIAVSNHLSTKRQGKRSYRQRMGDYERQRATAELEISQAMSAEEAVLREGHLDPAALSAVAVGPQRRLWERRPGDPDFLELRVGLTDRRADVEIRGSVTDATDSARPPDQWLRQVPATVQLAGSGVLGIAGANEQSQALARWLVAQIATWHAPDDVSIAVLGSPGAPERWAWARWLPHARVNRERCVAQVALTDAAVYQLANELAAEVDRRLAMREVQTAAGPIEAPVVAVIDGVYRLGALPAVTRLLRGGPAVGIYAICIEESEHFLPEECRAATTFDAHNPTRLTTKGSDIGSNEGVLADLVAVGWAESLARSLAPLRLTRGQEVAATIPSSLRLLDELGLEPPDPDRLVATWEYGGRTTSALIGRNSAGPLILDLARHGPHGLVAGTTGSGKSELLQTLIATLAIVNRPDAMTFVLVDYKGGSAFGDCARLPHTVGLVTDLDGHLTERALVSLSAELRRRERVLLEAGAKDIDDLIRVSQRAGLVPALSRLLIVIDEFASLVEELPDFVDGLVDIARRGRSLGIHLVLATQRPAGVVSAPIKANTNFRIAMRVTDGAESTDVIDAPLAARISKDIPGRGYLRVGHDQLTEFQAARVGGLRRTRASTSGVEVYSIGYEHLTTPLPAVSSGTESENTDLFALVEAANEAAQAARIVPGPSPWMAPLPDVVVLDGPPDATRGAGTGGSDTGTGVGESLPSSGLLLTYGLEDVPEEQRQAPAIWDVEHGGHLLVVGDAGSGRSTALRALAGAIGRQASVADLHLYGIDCGNGMLGPMATLPHCGAIAGRIETDRVDRVIGRLSEEVARRQQLLARGGFASIGDQRSTSGPDGRLPYLVLFVDRWEGFTSAFELVDNGRLIQQVLHLMREGVGAGLRVVLAGDRSLLSSRIASLADQTLVLRLNDRATYGSAGLNPRQVPDHQPPGRALRAYGRTELQVAVLDSDTSGPAQVKALGRLADHARARWGHLGETAHPLPIGVLPTYLELEDLPTAHHRPNDPGRHGGAPAIVLGVGGDRLAPCVVHLGAETSAFIVAGPPGSGRSNVLGSIAHQALAAGVGLVALTTRRSPLAGLVGREGVRLVADANTVPPAELEAALSEPGPVFVLVDDAELAAAPGIAEALIGFLRKARDTGDCLVVGGGAVEMATGLRGFLAEARKAKFGVLLMPSAPTDGDVLGIRLPRTTLSNGPKGRGILVNQQSLSAIQVALATDIAFS